MSEDAVALIKENLNLADLVGRYTQLKRKGNKLTACCPFHNEKTPSFYVDPQKGFFHCFGCRAGGDMIQFAMDIEGMTFREALEFLADIAGINLPRFQGRGPAKDVIDTYRAINEEAVVFYQQQLKRNQQAMDYLAGRGIKENTIKLFRLGYAPNQWDGLINHLRNRFDQGLLNQCGLFKTSQNGRVFDMFRDRVIFPIRDVMGNTVAFGGRLMEGEGPKYINSPETPLYTKGKHLYNLDFAKALLKRDDVEGVVVVEGYMDVIQVYQAGVMNVIASLGTAFTADQARLIQRHTDKVFLNFDGDRAGFKAARTSIETCLQKDLKIGVIALPGGQDPDDYIREHGVKAYREELEQAAPFYDFLLAYFSKDRDIHANPHERSFLAQEVCSTLKYVDDPVVRGFYLEKLSGDLEVPTHVLSQLLDQGRAPNQPGGQPHQVQAPAPVPSRPPVDPAAQRNLPVFSLVEREFLFHVMNQPDFNLCFKEENRASLPQILGLVFRDRAWLLGFIYFDHPEADLEERLTAVPEQFRPVLRGIFFDEAYQDASSENLDVLFLNLVESMMTRMIELNKMQLRALPSSDVERFRELRNTQHKLKKELQLIRQS